jgi:hypothetical protein
MAQRIQQALGFISVQHSDLSKRGKASPPNLEARAPRLVFEEGAPPANRVEPLCDLEAIRVG